LICTVGVASAAAQETRREAGKAVIEETAEIDPKRPTDQTEDGSFVDLFNGNDPTGWVVEGTANNKDGQPVWAAQDGMIVCKGHGYGFLRYDRQVSDFILALDFRLDRGANSGIGIRHAKFTGERKSRPSFSGYEIQLIDENNKSPSKTSSGSLYRYVAPKTQATKPAGEWNTMVVECRGPKIIVKLNDKLIHDLDQTSIEEIARKPLSGYISLQNHGGDIAFRNIRLKTLN